MLEIALGVARDQVASKVFQSHFISDGGDFEPLIEKHGFALTRMEPRLTPEKIEHIAKVDRGEKFTPAFTDAEMIQRVENESPFSSGSHRLPSLPGRTHRFRSPAACSRFRSFGSCSPLGSLISLSTAQA